MTSQSEVQELVDNMNATGILHKMTIENKETKDCDKLIKLIDKHFKKLKQSDRLKNGYIIPSFPIKNSKKKNLKKNLKKNIKEYIVLNSRCKDYINGLNEKLSDMKIIIEDDKINYISFNTKKNPIRCILGYKEEIFFASEI